MAFRTYRNAFWKQVLNTREIRSPPENLGFHIELNPEKARYISNPEKLYFLEKTIISNPVKTFNFTGKIRRLISGPVKISGETSPQP